MGAYLKNTISGGTKSYQALIILSLWAALLVVAPALGETLEDRIPQETFEKLMRSVIIAETQYKPAQKPDLKPLSADCALMNCGASQKELVHILTAQGIPAVDIRLFQAEEAFGSHGLAHAAVRVTVKDRDGQPVRLIIDPTFAQFAQFDKEWLPDKGWQAAVRLSGSMEGRDMLLDLARYGMYELTDPRLELLNEAMTMEKETGKPRVQRRVTLGTLEKASYHSDVMKEVLARKPVADYLKGENLQFWLDVVNTEAVQARISRGEEAARGHLDRCQVLYRVLNFP